MEYVVLNKLVNMTADRFRQVASSKGVEIKTVLPPQVITVPGNIDVPVPRLDLDLSTL